MKWYRCLIEGENFPAELLSQIGLVGFYTTKYVEAKSPEEAENIALSNLKNEESLQLPKGIEPSKNAKVYFEEITEINKSEISKNNTGFTFFGMES